MVVKKYTQSINGKLLTIYAFNPEALHVINLYDLVKLTFIHTLSWFLKNWFTIRGDPYRHVSISDTIHIRLIEILLKHNYNPRQYYHPHFGSLEFC